MIGEIVTVTVDRPLGSCHPKYKEMIYPINYGYIQGTMTLDGEEQDAYVLGPGEAVEQFTGKVIAVICRENDVEDKWVVASEGKAYTKEEIWRHIEFQEKYFQSEIII